MNAPPHIWLINTTEFTEFVSVRQFASYEKCEDGVAPTPDELCEPGAIAMDPEDGDLTFRVFSCPPASCIERGDGCTGHEFSKKGLLVRASSAISPIGHGATPMKPMLLLCAPIPHVSA